MILKKTKSGAARPDVFEYESIPKAVAVLTIPTVLSMLVTIIYNMADTFFIGQTGNVSMMAAISLTTPVFPIFMAIANVFGAGGSSFISRAFGGGQHETAKKVSSFCFYGSIIVGLVIGVVLLAAMPGVLTAIGSSDQTVGYAGEYLNIIAVGTPVIVLSNALTHIVRSEGRSKESMIGMMIGTIANILLDPLFILGFGWGPGGAAFATVLGNLLSIVYFLDYFIRGKSRLSIHPRDFTIREGIPGGVIVVGLPASMNNICMCLANVVINNIMAGYGDNAVAAMGIGMKVNMLVGMLQLGFGMGLLPLIGYNYGAKKYEKMKRIMMFGMGCTITIGLILAVLCAAGAGWISRQFIDNSEVMARGTQIIRAYMISGPVMGVIFIIMNGMQAMKKSGASLLLSVSRQGIIFIPLAFIFNALWGLYGAIYAQPAADLLSAVIAVVLFIRLNKKLKLALSGNCEEKSGNVVVSDRPGQESAI